MNFMAGDFLPWSCPLLAQSQIHAIVSSIMMFPSVVDKSNNRSRPGGDYLNEWSEVSGTMTEISKKGAAHRACRRDLPSPVGILPPG